MRDDEIRFAPGIDPLGKAIGNALRKRLHVRRPGENDFGLSLFLERFRNGDHISKTLQRMKRGTFETYNRNAGVFNELPDEA